MRLVSPDRVLYIVEDKAELKALTKRLNLGWKLGGNLRQLCGWDQTGGGDEKGNWQRLESVVWLKHDSRQELVPLVGKVSHMFSSVVQQRPDMSMTEESLRKLVPSRSGRTFLDVVDGWRRAAMPPEVMQVADGTSLVASFFTSAPDAIQLPDFVQPQPHVPPRTESFGALTGAAGQMAEAAAGGGGDGILAPAAAGAIAPTQVRSPSALKPTHFACTPRCPSCVSSPASADAT